MRNISFHIALLLFSFTLFAQELPPISTYSPKDYQAGIQNWMITQNDENEIFIANNEGLLQFNGSKWRLYPTPNNSIMRSVFCQRERVYTGAYMDFGFWSKNEHKKLIYQSLRKKLNLLEDEQFWDIISYDKWILFQSLQRIYIYDTKSGKIQIIDPKSPIFKVYKTNNQIFFQTNLGLYELDNGSSKQIISEQQLNGIKIVDIFNKRDQLILVTRQNGIFQFSDSILSPYSTVADEQLKYGSVYDALQLSNGDIAVGTISKGIFILNENTIRYHITQQNGISNNTILSLFEDTDHNLWLGLDNGIDCLNLRSSVKKYANYTGVLGTVYSSIVYQDYLYIGTNQGLFFKNNNYPGEFQFVNGTKGQVWSLFIHEDTLFCGHDLGTMVINGGESNVIYNASGTWKFEPFQNKIIQGNYYGLSLLTKINGNWTFERKIPGFNYSCRFFEIVNQNEFLVSHEYRGLYRLVVENNFSRVNKFSVFEYPKKSKNASLVKFNNKIYYASQDGIFIYEPTKKSFAKSASLSAVFEHDEYVTGKMVTDKSNYLWVFTKNYLYYFSKSKLSDDLNKNSIPISSDLTNSMPGFENIYEIKKNEYLIGTTDGYYILRNEPVNHSKHRVAIAEITANSLEEKSFSLSTNEKSSLKHHQNNIRFSFSVPQYDAYINSEYQYILEGFQEKWSKWSSKSEVSFENLKPGTYTFKVKAKVSNAETENIVSYQFEIKKPWYFSHLAIVCYVLLLLIMAYYINKLYKDNYNKKHQKIIAENNLLLELKELETQKEIMKLKNKELAQDVDKKNKELAVSTMNLIKKDELLKIIKEDLKSSAEPNTNKNLKTLITTINKTVLEDDTWNVFKEAFDKADNDFIKKVKSYHPSLTPNDLRLCAYLRLNLSSKEIAPLLNISVRSVEIKRYRLRKKMDLPHEQSLVEYILSI